MIQIPINKNWSFQIQLNQFSRGFRSVGVKLDYLRDNTTDIAVRLFWFEIRIGVAKTI